MNEKERNEGRSQLGGQWKVLMFGGPLEGFNVWWPLEGSIAWWSMEGSNVW
jgi:hypothetical protein